MCFKADKTLAYIATYSALRATGHLVIDTGWAPDRIAFRENSNSEIFKLDSDTPIPKLFTAGRILEALLSGNQYFLGDARSNIRYKGEFTQAHARSLLNWILKDIPASAGRLTGEYDCAFYDDDIYQKVTFHLNKESWDEWRSHLKDSLGKFRSSRPFQ